MSPWKLALKSLWHYRWLNLAVLIGVTLTSAILSGALVVGDSVRESLRYANSMRISKAEYALVGGDRYFTAGLADRLSEKINGTVAPLLQNLGTATDASGGNRANNVQVLGATDEFWRLSFEPENGILEGEDLVINETLARRLELEIGDTIIVRVELPGAISKDAPLSGASNQTVTVRSKIGRILGGDQFGRYNLNTEQIPVPTVYLPLERLQEMLEKEGRANVLLISARHAGFEHVTNAIERSWTLADAQLDLQRINDGQTWELGSERIFLDRNLTSTVRERHPNSTPVLTYLVNSIKHDDRTTPYSMATAAGHQTNDLIPENLGNNEAIVTSWLAEDLGLEKGAEISLTYFIFGEGRELEESSSTFTVREIVDIDRADVNRQWTPQFPGIMEAEDSREWQPGIPINEDRIRDKDEDYWDEHNATPKVFVSYEAGKKMWGNRFGDATAIRFPENAFDSAEEFERNLKKSIGFTDFNLLARNLRSEASDAVKNSYDFGGLFAGMSFFLIIAALVLTALVFVFGIEQRRNQIGLLLSVGMRKRQVRRLFLNEAAILAVAGASLGLLAGTFYTKLALWGLSGAWSEAAAGLEFVYHATALSLELAWSCTVLLSLIVVFFASRAVSAVQPSQLISGIDPMGTIKEPKPLRKSFSFWIAVLALIAGLLTLVMPQSGTAMARQGAFFGGGFLLVVAGISFALLRLDRMRQGKFRLHSLDDLGRTNAVRRKWRSLSVVALMASGVFMVTAINSLRLSGQTDAGNRSSGTGGFAYLAQSTLPIYENLNTEAGRQAYNIDTEVGGPDDFQMVQFRMNQGDDASCLNLNRAQQPRVLGVDPRELAKRDAFYFTQALNEESPWLSLRESPEERDGVPVIPGIMDAATAQYALGLKMGDHLRYVDADGNNFDIQLAGLIDNSVLQGSVVISEENYIRFFPTSGGYRFFLMDVASPEAGEEQAEMLTRMLADRGLEIVPAWQRLNEYNAVQNTYLSIFSTLGGLGLLLGTVGLGVVVGRNILERRGQMGLMEAVGFRKKALARLVVSEHWFLHVFGVVLGIVAGLVAVLPTLLSRGSDMPVTLLVVMNGLILAGGLLFCWLAARLMLRKDLIDSLRHE